MFLQVAASIQFSAFAFAGLFNRQVTPVRPSPVFIHDGDAIYDLHTTRLQSILTCPNGGGTSPSTPVLLVHGANSTGSESWSRGYVHALEAFGYTPCYLDLPRRGTGDMQMYSAYVAYNLHHLAGMSSGKKVTVIGHGQANSVIQWALQFYPSTQHVTRAFIALSPNLAGIKSADQGDHCEIMEFSNELRCRPFAWQQRFNSSYYTALRHKYLVAQVPTTLIWSESDETFRPARINARLAGATSIAVQHLCPTRAVSTSDMLTDAVAFRLVRDSLRLGGQGSLGRLRPRAFEICRQRQMVHRTEWFFESWWAKKQKASVDDDFPNLAPRLAGEPPVKSYAQLRNQ